MHPNILTVEFSALAAFLAGSNIAADNLAAVGVNVAQQTVEFHVIEIEPETEDPPTTGITLEATPDTSYFGYLAMADHALVTMETRLASNRDVAAAIDVIAQHIFDPERSNDRVDTILLTNATTARTYVVADSCAKRMFSTNLPSAAEIVRVTPSGGILAALNNRLYTFAMTKAEMKTGDGKVIHQRQNAKIVGMGRAAQGTVTVKFHNGVEVVLRVFPDKAVETHVVKPADSDVFIGTTLFGTATIGSGQTGAPTLNFHAPTHPRVAEIVAAPA